MGLHACTATGQVRRVALQQAPPARPEERTVLQLHSTRGIVAVFSLGLHGMVAWRLCLTLNLDLDAGDSCSLYTASLLALEAQASLHSPLMNMCRATAGTAVLGSR